MIKHHNANGLQQPGTSVTGTKISLSHADKPGGSVSPRNKTGKYIAMGGAPINLSRNGAGGHGIGGTVVNMTQTSINSLSNMHNPVQV